MSRRRRHNSDSSDEDEGLLLHIIYIQGLKSMTQLSGLERMLLVDQTKLRFSLIQSRSTELLSLRYKSEKDAHT